MRPAIASDRAVAAAPAGFFEYEDPDKYDAVPRY